MTMDIGEDASGVHVWRNAHLATLASGAPGLGLVERGAVAVRDGRIAYTGPEADVPANLMDEADIVTDCDGRLITPGLIDCHTHLVYAGNRAHEFELRLAGATYEEVARAGGGIVSTVRAVREASAPDLLDQTLPRLDALIAEGVTTVEVKSGYGLDLQNELKSLRAARQLGDERPITVATTFLGAHALPPEFRNDSAGYIEVVANEMIPAVAAEDLAGAVDGFAETIAFSNAEIERVFEAAKRHGLPVKLHADQLSDMGGAELAARFGA
ncbi:MAG: imidazolonepropionase, partial [Chloroflexota bacterium]|nr:imidazolonepropionase [Chloroflexota bacterium]